MAPEEPKRTGIGVSPRTLRSVTTGLLKTNANRRKRAEKVGQDIQNVLRDAMEGKRK